MLKIITTEQTKVETVIFLNLLIEMTKKELKARYKNTIFGFLWIFINPILQAVVIGFVFRFFIKEPIEHYYLYLLTGLLVWNFFYLTITKVTPSILNERALIKKAAFAREIIPLSIILSNLVNLIAAFAVIMVPVINTNILSISNLPNFILGLFLLVLFTTGFGLLTTSLNVRYRDINFFVQAILIIWFYATPIVYSIHFIPHHLMWLWRLNPMVSIVQLFQNALVTAPAPGVGMFLSNMLITFSVFCLGIVVFQRESKYFDDWI